MSETAHLSLPLLAGAQSQKHVTHNEALLLLDALVHLSVEDADLTAPPVTAADGERYLVATGATGDWAGHDGDIALRDGNGWSFLIPQTGWRVWIGDAKALLVFDGLNWVSMSAGAGGTSQSAALFGINATADNINRLSVSSAAVLFNHEGSDAQTKINKAATGNTASLLFQTGFSGRAEFGLAGDDDFRIKVSPDGSVFKTALHVDRVTGKVGFPSGLAGLPPGGAAGQVLSKIDGTDYNTAWTTPASGGGSGGGSSVKLKAIRVLQGSTTWVKPAGLDHVLVHVIGGGGGGRYSNSMAGAGGGYAMKFIAAALLASTENVTVGAGGVSGASGVNSGYGGDGGASSFGSHCSATGGQGGGYKAANAPADTYTALGGTGSGGDINLTGESRNGNNKVGYSTRDRYRGGRAAGPFAGVGGMYSKGTVTTQPEINGQGFGAGGGGSASSDHPGAGHAGAVIVFEYGA